MIYLPRFLGETIYAVCRPGCVQIDGEWYYQGARDDVFLIGGSSITLTRCIHCIDETQPLQQALSLFRGHFHCRLYAHQQIQEFLDARGIGLGVLDWPEPTFTTGSVCKTDYYYLRDIVARIPKDQRRQKRCLVCRLPASKWRDAKREVINKRIWRKLSGEATSLLRGRTSFYLKMMGFTGTSLEYVRNLLRERFPCPFLMVGHQRMDHCSDICLLSDILKTIRMCKQIHDLEVRQKLQERRIREKCQKTVA